MEQVVEKARDLGEAILASEPYKRMQSAEDVMQNDPAVAAMLSRISELKNTFQSLQGKAQSEGELLDLKNCVAEIESHQKQLNQLPTVQEAMEARQAFSALMTKINQILEFTITGEIAAAEGCSGSCGTCGRMQRP